MSLKAAAVGSSLKGSFHIKIAVVGAVEVWEGRKTALSFSGLSTLP
jgi:hypothetical protein